MYDMCSKRMVLIRIDTVPTFHMSSDFFKNSQEKLKERGRE